MSLSKAHLQRYRKLHHAKGRREAGLFLVEGPVLIGEALKEGWPLEEVLLTSEFAASDEGHDLVQKLALVDVPFALCTRDDLAKAVDTVTPQNAAAQARLPDEPADLSISNQFEMILICEAVSDPGNLGTLIRTADWFGLGQVILGEGSADPFSPKVVRSTAGSIFRVKTVESDNLTQAVEREKAGGRALFAAFLQGDLLPTDMPKSGLRGLVVGHETRGVSPEIARICQATVRIPGSGKAESLNLAVAAGILLYAFFARFS
jgi:TrmH family RNA methyltransferase